MSHFIAEKTIGPKYHKRLPLASQKVDGISGASGCPLETLLFTGHGQSLWAASSGPKQVFYLIIPQTPLPKQVSKLVNSCHLHKNWRKRQTGANKSHTAHPLLSIRKHIVHKPHPGHSALGVSTLLIVSAAPSANHALVPPTDNNPDSHSHLSPTGQDMTNNPPAFTKLPEGCTDCKAQISCPFSVPTYTWWSKRPPLELDISCGFIFHEGTSLLTAGPKSLCLPAAALWSGTCLPLCGKLGYQESCEGCFQLNLGKAASWQKEFLMDSWLP